MDQMKRAYELLKEWKGDSYVHGLGVLDQVGPLAAAFGKRALVVSNTTYMKPVADRVVSYLQGSGVELAGNVIAPDAKPNAPVRTSIDWSLIFCIPSRTALLSSAAVRQSMP